MTNTTIQKNLLDAYHTAEYHVDTLPPLILKIGVYSHELMRLYENSTCNSAAFVTAYNPASQELANEINVARNKKLEELIQSQGYLYLYGAGRCAEDNDIGEISLLILGMDKETASDIGKQFEQNAIVWCAGNAVPQLILLK